MASALDQYDPDNLLNVIKELEGRIQALEQGYVSANSADELVSDGGDLGDYTGNTVIPASDSEITDVSDPDFTGLFMSAEGVDIDGVVYSMGSLTMGVLQWGVVKDEPIIVVGDHAVELSDAGITAVAGLIGGWEIVTDVLQKLSADVGISLNATDRIIKVGNTAGNHIQIDGANERIRSSNFVTGKTGMNIDAATGDAEFNNLVARGELRTFLLTAENQMAVSGQIMISKDAGKIAAAASSVATSVDFGKTMTVGDWVKFHGMDAAGNNSVEWMLIGTLVSGTTYNVTRNVDGSGANGWAEDTAFAVIGKSGDARIELVAGASGTIRLITQGATWNTQTIQAEMSTVDGAITAGAGAVKLDENGMSIEVPSSDASPNQLKWVDGTNTIFSTTTVNSGGSNVITNIILRALSKTSIFFIRALSDATYPSTMYLDAQSGGSSTHLVRIELISDSDGTNSIKINRGQADADTSIFGTSATPIIKVDAGNNTLVVNGGAEISGLTHGTYTPTINNITNVSSSTAFACQYMRVGNTVTVSGQVTIDPTAAGACEIAMTLPIASAITAIRQCAGVATTAGVAGVCIAILADTINDKASFQWVAVDVASRNYFFTFTYLIL